MLTNVVKHYPQIAPTTPMNRESAIEQIEKICAMTSSDVKAVLDALQYVIEQACKNGIAVRLGDLGSFRPTLSTEGSDTALEVTSDKIKRVRVRYPPSGALVRKLDVKNCQFGLQATE